MPSDPWGPDPWKGPLRLTEREQQLRAERLEFRDSLREWIATKWDGEPPEHLKKALTTGDPEGLGLLIHEWRAFGHQKEIQTTDATFIKRLDFPLADLELHPHRLRHSHATHAVRRGVDVFTLQSTLGHSSSATTGYYVAANPEDSSFLRLD